MFKINDIIRLTENYSHVIYPTDFTSIEQSYIVKKVIDHRITIVGLINNYECTISHFYFELDKQHYRTLKLKKICLKLEKK